MDPTKNEGHDLGLTITSVSPYEVEVLTLHCSIQEEDTVNKY